MTIESSIATFLPGLGWQVDPGVGVGPEFFLDEMGGGPSVSAAGNTLAMTSAITKAIALGGGTIKQRKPGIWLFSATIPQPNFTVMDTGSGVVNRRAASVNAPLLKARDSAYYLSGDKFTRTSNVVTALDIGHTFTVGQRLWLPPARFTDSTFGGLAVVLAVTAGSWTYASAGANGAGGTSIQYVGVFPVSRTIAVANVASVTVNATKYLQITDDIGELKIGAQVYLSTDNTADVGFIGLTDVAVVTPTGFLIKTPGGTSGVPTGNLLLNYNIGQRLTGFGEWDGNYTNQGSGNTIQATNVIEHGNVSFGGIDLGVKLTSSNSRCLNTFNPSNYRASPTVSNCKVGWQVEGGSKKLTVPWIGGSSQQNSAWDGSATAQANDDMFALTNTLYTGDGSGGGANYDNVSSPYGITDHDCTGHTIDAGHALNGLKITGDISALTNATFAVIKHKGYDPNLGVAGAAIAIVDDGPHLTGTRFGVVSVGRIIWDEEDSSTTSQRNVVWNATGNSGQLIVGGLTAQASMAQGIILNAGTTVVTAATDATTITVTHDGTKKFVTGQKVTLTGITQINGVPDLTANGVWRITVTDSTHFTFTYTRGTAGALSGTILATGGNLESFVAEYTAGLPAASGSRTLFSGSTGSVDMMVFRGLQMSVGAGTGAPPITTGVAFWCPTIKFEDIKYGAETNNTGAALFLLSGNHKKIIFDNCQPTGNVLTNGAGFGPVAFARFQNTVIPQTVDVHILNSHIRASSGFNENGANIGASVFNFKWVNSTWSSSNSSNNECYRFSGAGATIIHHIADNTCDFSAAPICWTSTTATIRFNGSTTPVNLNTLAAKIATASQVDGDRCLSTAAVNGLPASNIEVEWSAILSKFVSVKPVASGSAILVAGTKTVTNALMQATSEIRIRNRVNGGTPGAILPATYTAGTDFTLTSTLATDTSTLLWDMYGTN